MEKKYKLGYCSIVGDFFNKAVYLRMRECKESCERLVIGIPDEYVMARLFGDSPYSAEDLRRVWLDCRWVDDVIILDVERLNKQNVYRELQYDVCFYGSEYGAVFEEDQEFMTSHGVEFIPLMNGQIIEPVSAGRDAIRLALNNVLPDWKIVLWGAGEYFDYYMKAYGNKYVPAYAVDDNAENWNTEKQGIMIKSPDALKDENREKTFIIVCCADYKNELTRVKAAGFHNYRALCMYHEAALVEEFAMAFKAEIEYVDRAQGFLTELLREFARVCKKYGLRYYMICGTLIGVVRHADIIPWDDDIDIAMPREDFEKLKKIARDEWNNDEFLFLSSDELGNGAFLDCFPRLFYLKGNFPVKLWRKVRGKARADLDGKLWIDIYILDNASKNEKRHMLYMNMLKGVYALCMGHRGVINYSEYERKLSPMNMRLLKTAHKIGRCIPCRLLLRLYDRLSQYASKESCDDYCIANLVIFVIQRRHKKSFFGDGILKPFRDFEVMVPSDYDGLLKDMGYGNYMSFPSLSVRKPSHYFNTDLELW